MAPEGVIRFVVAELGSTIVDAVGLNVGSDSSRVGFDEIRMVRTFADVAREPPGLDRRFCIDFPDGARVQG